MILPNDMNQISPITGKSFMGYGPLGHNHDEMLFADGQIRPHWRDFTHGLDELGPEEFQNRWMESRQIIRENGKTYKV